MGKKTLVGNLEVSTWLTFDHGWETMIFNNVSGDTDVRRDLTRRHADQESAMVYHDKVVALLEAEEIIRDFFAFEAAARL